jgi:hypothetical protein
MHQSDLALVHTSIKTATALGKLGHPDGELNLTRAAAKHGVLQMVNIRKALPYNMLIYLLDTDLGIVFF